MKAQRGSRCRYSSPLSLTLVPERGRQLMPHPNHFIPRKETQYSLHRRLGGTPRPVWICMKNLDPPGLKPQTVQPAVCHYIAYAIPASQYLRNLNSNWNV